MPSFRLLPVGFLLQIDQCEQPIFAATNSSENRLDKALMRRMDFKLRFEYLTTQQVLTLYEENFGKFPTIISQQLANFTKICPGDFAIISRRNRLSRKPLTHVQNIQLLQEENKRKQHSQAIGFVH